MPCHPAAFLPTVALAALIAMNVLYLHSHDTGRHIQPYGYAVPTPHLQALAESGVLFRDAHCAAPTCSPSRAALLTGECAHSAGMVALSHRGGKLLHPERHLAQFLAGHGFETVCTGFSHVGKRPELGYTRLMGGDWKNSQATVDAATAFLRQNGSKKPFFLDVGFVETHRTEWVCHGFSQEHDSPRDGDGNPGYVMPPPPLPDTPETRRDWLDYLHSATRLDDYYGQVLKALDEAGLADDTLVIATTDHGIAFPDHKCKLTAHGTGVLMILRAPGAFPGGRVSDALVSQVDFYPTLCDILGIEKPEWLQGHSLLPLLKGETDQVREEVFAEVTFHGGFEPKRSVRTKRWNYIRNFSGPRQEVMVNCDDGHAKRLWIENGMAHQTVPQEELYDLMFDPQERRNLAMDKGCTEVKADLKQRLQAWMEATGDPLLDPSPERIPMPQKIDVDLLNPGITSGEWEPEEWYTTQHQV